LLTVMNVKTLSAGRRETIAVVVALLAILIGAAYSIWRGLTHDIAFDVGVVWAAVALWLDRPKLWNKRVGEIYQAAKERRLGHTGVWWALVVGTNALFITGILFWVRTGG
jgi:hypothetical protein